MVQIGITTVNLIYEDTKVRFLELLLKSTIAWSCTCCLDQPVHMDRLNYTCAQAVLRLGSSGLLEDRFLVITRLILGSFTRNLTCLVGLCCTVTISERHFSAPDKNGKRDNIGINIHIAPLKRML